MLSLTASKTPSASGRSALAKQKTDEAIMAYVNSTRANTVSLSDRFGSLIAGFKAALARRRVYDQTVRELASLSDRDLADLGINRAVIAQVASEAAYGK
jgi:uncharacterized protein YjiS (DUF1127 family)